MHQPVNVSIPLTSTYLFRNVSSNNSQVTCIGVICICFLINTPKKGIPLEEAHWELRLLDGSIGWVLFLHLSPKLLMHYLLIAPRTPVIYTFILLRIYRGALLSSVLYMGTLSRFCFCSNSLSSPLLGFAFLAWPWLATQSLNYGSSPQEISEWL